MKLVVALGGVAGWVSLLSPRRGLKFDILLQNRLPSYLSHGEEHKIKIHPTGQMPKKSLSALFWHFFLHFSANCPGSLRISAVSGETATTEVNRLPRSPSSASQSRPPRSSSLSISDSTRMTAVSPSVGTRTCINSSYSRAAGGQQQERQTEQHCANLFHSSHSSLSEKMDQPHGQKRDEHARDDQSQEDGGDGVAHPDIQYRGHQRPGPRAGTRQGNAH